MKNIFLSLALLAFILLNSPGVQAQQNNTGKTDLNIVFIGNSITHGAGLPNWKTDAPPNAACAWLSQQDKAGHIDFSNQGVSGHTTVDFLPSTNKDFANVVAAARAFKNQNAQLVFSIVLGTNDSAEHGPNGAPLAKEAYAANLKAIIDSLLTLFPNSKLVIQQPIWYSPNTHNRSAYMQQGLDRLQSYFPMIRQVVNSYKVNNPRHVFLGDTGAYKFFEDRAAEYLQHESGVYGIFYLHPTKEGAAILGEYWAKAIYKTVF